MQRDGLASATTALPAGSGRPREAPAGAALPEISSGASEDPVCSTDATVPGATAETLCVQAHALPAQEQEQAVARLFEAFSRRDLPSALALVHPEVVFQPMTAAVTRAGEPYRGHEGIHRYAKDVEENWDELTIQPVQIRAAGHAVVVLGMVSGRGRGGAFENAPTTWVIKFRDGLVIGAQIFSDERNVREALHGQSA
jgi:ketosteroid isomerase-like protein